MYGILSDLMGQFMIKEVAATVVLWERNMSLVGGNRRKWKRERTERDQMLIILSQKPKYVMDSNLNSKDLVKWENNTKQHNLFSST